jgi:hypothetical protein
VRTTPPGASLAIARQSIDAPNEQVAPAGAPRALSRVLKQRLVSRTPHRLALFRKPPLAGMIHATPDWGGCRCMCPVER